MVSLPIPLLLNPEFDYTPIVLNWIPLIAQDLGYRSTGKSKRVISGLLLGVTEPGSIGKP